MLFLHYIRMMTLTILLSSSRGVESFTSPILTTKHSNQSTVTGMARLDSNSNEKNNKNVLSVATASAFLAWTLFSGSALADGTLTCSVLI